MLYNEFAKQNYAAFGGNEMSNQFNENIQEVKIPINNEFDFTNNVAMGNDIIEAFPSLTTLQIKLFNMSVSSINTNEDNENPGVVYLSKDKLLTALKFEGKNKNVYL